MGIWKSKEKTQEEEEKLVLMAVEFLSNKNI